MSERANTAVQYDDVARAAVRVLIAGNRPTVRAVRDVIGRGSPNVILPHLTTWFENLGRRLSADPELGCGVPAVQVAPSAGWPPPNRSGLEAETIYELQSSRGMLDTRPD